MMSDFKAGEKPILYEVVKDGFRCITTDTPDGTEESVAKYRRADLPPTDAQIMADVRVKALLPYIQHTRACDRMSAFIQGKTCTCGLSAALAQLKGSKG
jgi:hypothetical protein